MGSFRGHKEGGREGGRRKVGVRDWKGGRWEEEGGRKGEEEEGGRRGGTRED